MILDLKYMILGILRQYLLWVKRLVTDGVISSKTDLDVDITKYQINSSIQRENSEVILFDDQGNFIGINAKKLNVKIANITGYSIKTSVCDKFNR